MIDFETRFSDLTSNSYDLEDFLEEQENTPAIKTLVEELDKVSRRAEEIVDKLTDLMNAESTDDDSEEDEDEDEGDDE